VQFGLRGDPYLWQVLRTDFAETPMPSSWFELRGIVFEAVECVIGQQLNEHADPVSVYVADFDPGHGMSAGQMDCRGGSTPVSRSSSTVSRRRVRGEFEARG
jgi:hypothetical protein